MKKITIGFFGCGNMSAAIVERLSTNKRIEMYFYSPSQNKAKSLFEKFGGHFITELDQMPSDLDWYFLGFKPQNLQDFNFKFRPSNKIVSMLAGTTLQSLLQKFNTNKIIRIMPNTPVKVGAGVILYFFDNQHFSKEDIIQLESMFTLLGMFIGMGKESELDLATAFSGSGPALIFELARMFASKLNVVIGDSSNADKIITQTFLGSAKLMSSSELSFEELRNNVTSAKGVTFEALQVLESNQVSSVFDKAFEAAMKKVNEMRGSN